jgi:ABC-type branched-subunit amino acid transport system substrate-binding protein
MVSVALFDAVAPEREDGLRMNGLGKPVRIVSSLTRSGSSAGQSDAIVNAIRMRLEDAGGRVIGVPVVFEDLDGGSTERGSWDAAREQANARYAAAQPDVVAYIATLDTDAAPYSIPITNAAGPLLMISPCNTYPGLTRPFAPGEPDLHYPTGRRNYLRTALSDHLQGAFAAQWAAELWRAPRLRPARHGPLWPRPPATRARRPGWPRLPPIDA